MNKELKMIKNIEDLKNIQIVCRNQEQVKNCLNYLEQLGFGVEKNIIKVGILFFGEVFTKVFSLIIH